MLSHAAHTHTHTLENGTKERWSGGRQYIDYAECKPEGEEPNVTVRVGWAPWVDEHGRSHPHTTTWEPLEALGLSLADVRELVRPGTALHLPHPSGLTDEERASVETVRRLLGLRRRRRGGRGSSGRGKGRSLSHLLDRQPPKSTRRH